MSERRSNGEGSITQRADGRWYGQIRVGQRRRSVYGKTRKDVVDQLHVIRHDAMLGQTVSPSSMETGAYLTSWLEGAAHLRPSTRHLYHTTIVVHIVPTLGHIKLKNLAPIHLQECYRRVRGRGEGMVRTTERVHRLLHKALGDAVRLRLLPSNPASLLDVQKSRPAERVLWTNDQIHALSTICRKYEHAYDALWMFLLATGCREGEALALREEHVDWEKSTVTIKRAIAHVGNDPYEDDPKTSAGVRRMVVPIFGMEALRSRRAYATDGYLFRSLNGSIPRASDLRKRFKETCWRAGIPDGTPHDLRRMSATLSIAGGVDVKSVQKRLGHTTLAMTLGLYARAMEMGDITAAHVLDAAVTSIEADTGTADDSGGDAKETGGAPAYVSGRRRSLSAQRSRHTPVRSQTPS